jgi:hypothetical protein
MRLKKQEQSQKQQSPNVMLDVVSNIIHTCVNYAHTWLAMKAKFSLRFYPKGQCVGTGNASRMWPFCFSGASDAKESRLVSASCTAKTKSKAGVKPAPLQRIYSLGLRAIIHTLRPRHRFIGGVADSFIR